MSRVYWRSPSRTAELRGSERAWLRHVARGPALAAWDFDRDHALWRAALLLGWSRTPGDSDEGYLHRHLREAQAADAANWAAITEQRYDDYDRDTLPKLISSLQIKLGNGLDITVAGVDLATNNIELNTALAAGSDPVRLAAKISGWCESHCWVDGPDRAWMAGIIDQGLDRALYRRGMWYVDRPLHGGEPEDQPDRKWSDQGWDDVLTLLRECDDEPVVLSYSVSDGFPNPEIAAWAPIPTSYGSEPEWSDDAWDGWGKLPVDEQWRLAMAGLREQRPWAQISPETLGEVYFHFPVTIYDLFAPDRDERVRAAAGLVAEPETAP